MLYEAKMHDIFDQIILIEVDEEEQKNRAINERNLDLETYKFLKSRFMNFKEKSKLANHLLKSNSDIETNLLKIINEIKNA